MSPELLTSAFDYNLPQERIAQEPLAERDASRLLLVETDGSLNDHRFTDLPWLLQPGDLLVANETRVRRARLHGRANGGRAVELLAVELREDGDYLWPAMPRSSGRPSHRCRRTSPAGSTSRSATRPRTHAARPRPRQRPQPGCTS